VPSDLRTGDEAAQQAESLTWDDVAAKAEKSRDGIRHRVKTTVDEDKARDGLIRYSLGQRDNNR
jgi:hypothetical protein